MASVQTVFQRNEKKYLLGTQQADRLLTLLQRHMRQDEYGQYTICSLYYDTPDYRALQAGANYKEKLRLRSYGVPGTDSMVFLELKKKLEGVTYKRRVPLRLQQANGYLRHGIRPDDSQVFQEIDWFKSRYATEAKLVLSYDRIAFCGIEDDNLRLTMDTNVRWRDEALALEKGIFGEALLSPRQVLMEIKVPGAMPLWLVEALSAVEAYPTKFSKYRTACESKLYREAKQHAG